MGTRSTTIILDDENKELVRIYRQHDGYPSGHGAELAKLANRIVVNGFSFDMSAATHANGMGCLAAQIIAGLKSNDDGVSFQLGGIYVERPNGELNEWLDYVYVVSFQGVGKPPKIACREGSKSTRAIKTAVPSAFLKWAEKAA